ncbi:cobalt-precorrin-5B (C(1))-methyltransferase [Microaerobacter geothermalis]|uniref:cobalt-precorrin-5B (C(1))-methyltransferase n=1 Tax=Microaerobacter geothermalis TaxID=674972 RepID=UPI001F22287B|nr:cobalt-precorrin-5B (C(1))-methyltransferase [Microaerobacter geothermalis]MCF6095267.1 cobalt-precorrin-5B (C(1))-methyltransferase [Microaerobacter geothermalis]
MEKQEKKPLRYGYTTGSCATATAKAALLALIEQKKQEKVTIKLPTGEAVTFQLKNCEFTGEMAVARVIKDGGDDPDATHGALIETTVTWKPEPGIVLEGGKGVGRVTKPGLPVPVGEAAINPVPRKMIMETVQEVLEEYRITLGVKVVVSVPDGEEIAKKTLNGRLGIIGGISILGTRGIVVPFSNAAYKASIVQAIRVAILSGCDHLVLSTGGRSEKYGMEMYPTLPEEAFIEMGDFVGFALKQCKKENVKRVTLMGMMGKFSKLAQGVMMVHAKSAPVDFGFLSQIAEESGVPEQLREQILKANTASQVGDLMLEHGQRLFFQQLCEQCCRTGLREVGGGMAIETIITSLKGVLLGRVTIDESDWNR